MPPRPYFNMNEAFSFGSKTTLENWKFLVPVTLVWLIGSIMPIEVLESHNSGPSVNALGFLISSAIALFLTAGIIRISLAYVDGLTPGWSMFWTTPFNRLATLLAASLIAMVVVIIGYIPLIIPGIYLTYYFSQAKYLVIDGNTTMLGALKRSGELTRGVKLSLYGFGLVCGLIEMGGFLCFGIGILIALPIVVLAEAMVFRQLEASMSDRTQTPINSALNSPALAPIPQPMAPPLGWQQVEVPTQSAPPAAHEPLQPPNS